MKLCKQAINMMKGKESRKSIYFKQCSGPLPPPSSLAWNFRAKDDAVPREYLSISKITLAKRNRLLKAFSAKEEPNSKYDDLLLQTSELSPENNWFPSVSQTFHLWYS